MQLQTWVSLNSFVSEIENVFSKPYDWYSWKTHAFTTNHCKVRKPVIQYHIIHKHKKHLPLMTNHCHTGENWSYCSKTLRKLDFTYITLKGMFWEGQHAWGTLVQVPYLLVWVLKNADSCCYSGSLLVCVSKNTESCCYSGSILL